MTLDLDTIAKLTATIGFPVAVAAYVLVRLDKSVNRMAQMLHKMGTALEINNEKLSHIVSRRRENDHHGPPHAPPR